jgi:stress-induced morphogen
MLKRMNIRVFLRNMSSIPTTPVTKVISDKIQTALNPKEYQIFNDSHKHAGHAAMRGSSNITESHFRLVIVSEEFEGKSQPARHRMIYSLLQDELSAPNGVHALQLTTKTPAEFAKLQK